MKKLAPRHLPASRQPQPLPLKAWIKARGFTIKRLAEVLEVRPETISRIASGAQPLSLGMQRRISHQLGLTPEEEILAFGLPGRGTIGSGDRDIEARDGAGAAGTPRLMRIDRLRQDERPAVVPDPDTDNARLVEDADGKLLFLNEGDDFRVTIEIGEGTLSDPRWSGLVHRLFPLGQLEGKK